jgi:tetratricopeptide (TPR) repeat protein
MRRIAFAVAAIATPAFAQTAGGSALTPTCGEMPDALERAPIAYGGRRPCPPAAERAYQPRHAGLAYDVLALENEACFVPDAAYQELDAVIDATLARVGQPTNDAAGLTKLGLAFAEVMRERGYRLLVPTVNLGDALLPRTPRGGPTGHIVDCDTGAMMLITIARLLGMDASLVEMVATRGFDHNYVHYRLTDGGAFRWDVNGVTACLAPEHARPWEAVPLTDRQVAGYVVALRAFNWERLGNMDRALADWREAADLWPERPRQANWYAWAVAADRGPWRDAHKTEALAMAERAAAIEADSDHLDTLACAQALNGDYTAAAATEARAIAALPAGAEAARPELEARSLRFSIRQDCTGLRVSGPFEEFDAAASAAATPMSGGPGPGA